MSLPYLVTGHASRWDGTTSQDNSD